MLTDNQADVQSLLRLLPKSEHAEALRTLARLPYPAHRLLRACEAGTLDPWEARTALRRMREDCRPESVG